MMSGANSGKHKGSLFGLLGRMFGAGQSGEPVEAGAEQAPAVNGQSETARAGPEPKEMVPPAPDAAEPAAVDPEETLVLRPALRSSAPASGATPPDETVDAGQTASFAGSTPAEVDGSEGAEADWTTDGQDEILARLRAVRDGELPLTGGSWLESATARNTATDDDDEDQRGSQGAGAWVGLDWLSRDEAVGVEMKRGAADGEPEHQERMEAKAMGRKSDMESGDDRPAAADEDTTAADPSGTAADTGRDVMRARHDYPGPAEGEEADDAPDAGGTGDAATVGEHAGPERSRSGFVTVGPPADSDDTRTEPGMSEETVRRLIREELEGELGERLSANIRRLIREEVAHALLRQR